MLESIIDQSIQLTFWLQSLGDWLHPVMEFFTFLGNEEFYLLLMPVFIWVIDFRLGYKVGVMLLVTTGINELVKLVFRVPRPYWVNPEFAKFSKPAPGFGFPSGHSQTSLSIFGLLAYEFKKRGLTVVVVFTIFMIGVSRLFLGEHAYIDVLAGWTVGAIVLFTFVALADQVSKWFNGLGFGTKVGVVFAYSIVVILVGATITSFPRSYEVPVEWIENAGIAFPEEPINPLSLDALITAAASLFGVSLGYFWTIQRGGFSANSGAWWKRLVRFFIGLVGVLVFWMGLDLIFPDNADLISWAARYVRYGLVGLWISGLAPLVFIKLGLGEQEL